MTAAAKKIQQAIAQLPLEDMLTLHEHLVVSIHEKEDTEQLDPALRDEIQRRVQEIDSGMAEAGDAFDALKTM